MSVNQTVPKPLSTHDLLMAKLASIIIYEFIGFFSLLNNGLLIYLILSRRQLRKVMNIIISSMAIGTIIFAIFYCLLHPLEVLSFRINSIFCHLFGPFRNFSLANLSFHLSLLSLEKYIVIAYPFHSSQIITKFKIFLSLIFVWVGAFLLSFFPVFVLRKYDPIDRKCPKVGDAEQEFIYFTCFYALAFGLPLAIMLFAYGSICRIALKHMRDIREKNLPGNAEVHHEIRRRVHAAKPLLIMVGTFFIMWTPYIIFTVIIFIYGRHAAQRQQLLFHHEIFAKLQAVHRDILLPVALSYCAINPIIYGFFNPGIRRAFVAMITCKPYHAYSGGTSITSCNNDTSYKSNWNRLSAAQQTKA
ncbi:Neuropeptide Y receptor [Trichoplax sp. H2]|nr:Neuropeptide Y receptor [Trichoplax sp. H2]|eukprot:RDD38295.1 Neuropeptide Y receptor [Trichoplax sp. H2]